MHILFPKNFPDVLTSLPSHNIEVVKKIEKNKNLFNRLFISLIKQYSLENKVRNVGVDLDARFSNYIYDSKKNVQYIDSPMSGEPILIKKYIDDNLVGTEKEIALDYCKKFSETKDKIIELQKKKLLEIFR